METLKIAVIGTGGRANAHFATIPKLSDRYVLCAVADIDESRAKAVGERLGVRSYTRPEALLDEAKPHVVLITTPPEGHHVVTAQAAERGVHVISETPMSFSLACAKRMMTDAARHDVYLEVSENVRRWPMERLKRVVIESGALGALTQAQCWYGSGMYHGISAIRNAVLAPATQVIGHAQNVQMGPQRWFDPFMRRSAGAMSTTPSAPASPDADARVATWELGVTTFDNGVVSFHQFPIAMVRGNYWELFLTGGEIIAGDFYRYEGGHREKLEIETVHTSVDGEDAIDHMSVNVNDEQVVWENPHKAYPLTDADDIARADVLISVHRAATEGAELDYGGIGGYRDLEMMIGARESALRGNVPVSLPIEGELAYDRIQHDEYERRYGHGPFALLTTPDWTREANIAAELNR